MFGYGSALTLEEARSLYFERSGFPADGGYDARWVVLRLYGLPVGVILNTDMRRRAVRVHDLHHVLAEYDTTWCGEAEIAAWELASGCQDYWAAWALNSVAFVIGLVRFPRCTFRAWKRGRRSRNLYETGVPAHILTRTVGAVRAELGLVSVMETGQPVVCN